MNSLATVKTLLSSSTNTDDTYTTATDLVDELIIDKTIDTLTSNCNEDETNDNILSMPTYTEYKSPYRNYLLAANDNSIDYVDELNGSIDTDDALSFTPKITAATFRFSDYTLDALDASSTTIRSTTTPSIAVTPKTPDFLTKDFSPLNRIQNIDDLLSFTVTTNTTATNTTSSTLNSWNDANSEFVRKEIAHSTSARTRNPLLSAQNRFLSLSISPPLSRRQDMPVLRGTFVSL